MLLVLQGFLPEKQWKDDGGVFKIRRNIANRGNTYSDNHNEGFFSILPKRKKYSNEILGLG